MSVHERGRKPTLTADADALAKAPPAPAWLHAEAKAEWRRVMPLLVARKIVTRADLSGLENYCAMIGTVRRIERLQATGDAIDPKLFGVANRAAQTARQLASEYGLTPTSRARMGAVAPEDEADDDPLAVT